MGSDKKNRQPNLLFILCDQQRFDCIGNSGIRPVLTPNIDKIANSGVNFKKAYTPIPVCAPARQSLLCGMRPEAYGALWNFGITHKVCEVPQDSFMFTRHIKNAGYNTGHFGKWNVSEKLKPDLYGFDIYKTDDIINREINEKFPGIKYPNGFWGDPCPIPAGETIAHKTVDYAIETLKKFQAKPEPWFISLDFNIPHLPCRPSAPYDTMYKMEDIEKWGSFDDKFIGKPYMHRQQVMNWNNEDISWETWARTVALYYGMISQYDDAIGKLLTHLEGTGEIEDTLIIYTCDHGDLCGSHKMTDKHYVMYEDLIHVPLALRCDSRIKPQIFSGYVHNTLDIVPTMFDILGIPQPEGVSLHGESLYPVLTGNGDWTRDYAVSSYNGQQFGLYSVRSITTDRYKYVWNLSDIDELYDLKNDSWELDNLIYSEDKKEIISGLRRKLYDELLRCGDRMIEWTKDQLLTGRKI